MERVWDKISGRIDFFFYKRTINRYIKVATVVKQKIDDYLREKNITFTSTIVNDSEPEWAKVVIDVIVDFDDLDEVLKLWDELCKIAFKDLTNESIHGIMIHVEPKYRSK